MAAEKATAIVDQTKDAVAGLATKMTEVLGTATGKGSDEGPEEGSIYIDEKAGSDTTGNGTVTSPFLTLLQALISTTSASSPTPSASTKYLVRKPDSTELAEWVPATASSLKKQTRLAEGHWKKVKKAEEDKVKNEQDEKARVAREEKRREDAAKIILVEDETGGKAPRSKIGALAPYRGKKVRVCGWVHRLRSQKDLIFISLRDGTGFLQIVLAGDCARTIDALDLVTECSVEVVGELKVVPEGKTAPGGHELAVQWWKILGRAPGGVDAYASLFNEDTSASLRLNQRHLDLRAETPASIMKVRAAILTAFRASFSKYSIMEVTPPCIVQTSVEGGSTLFKFDYYGAEAYLTQSSQLYLETCLPSLGDVFCVQESFRAENSQTRRHLSEYTHLEAELGFIEFDDLMSHIETMVCEVAEQVLAHPVIGPMVLELNPKFVAPSRPFLRMNYKDAITYLNEHNILFQDDDPTVAPRHHVVGDDIAEAAERKMTDDLGVPMFLYGFPIHLKSFYMKKIKGDEEFTESCDLLMPNVGEIVGGSMRIADMAELLEGYKREGIPTEPYYWFTDQRKYGTTEHGGYGLGVERFLAWMTNRWTVRECQLYPRWPGHAAP